MHLRPPRSSPALPIALAWLVAIPLAFATACLCRPPSPPSSPEAEDERRELEELFLARGFVPGDDPATILDAFVTPPTQEPRLFRVNLPPGDSGSINVGWSRNGVEPMDPSDWLDDGDDQDPEPDDFDGILFVGAGSGLSHIRCTTWDGTTVNVRQHQGIVAFEGVTIHAGYDRGSNFGQQNVAKTLSPKFHAMMRRDVRWVADPPESAAAILASIQTMIAEGRTTEDDHPFQVIEARILEAIGNAANREGVDLAATPVRAKWLVFGYQVDLTMEGGELEGRELVEHDVYLHGFAQFGARLSRVRFLSSGSEGFKVRPDVTETAFAGPNTAIVIQGCTFENWRAPWNWRGGAGIVIQNGASHVLIERCIFRPGEADFASQDHEKGHCIEIAAEGSSYAHRTGSTTLGFGNGIVYVKECAMFARSQVEWNNSMLRVARNGGPFQAARSVTLERLGVWSPLPGPGNVVTVAQVPSGKFVATGCNTPAIAELSRGLGMDTTREGRVPTSSALVPLSRFNGVVR